MLKAIGEHNVLIMTLILLLLPNQSPAQDEAYFRSVFSGELKKKEEEIILADYKWEVSSRLYRFDFNGDYFPEYFQVSKRDGEDWFLIRDWKKKVIFEHKLIKSGVGSWPYKLSVAYLTSKIRLLVLHYYEGSIKSINFLGSSKLYFITIDEKLSDKFYFSEGPSIWDEKEKFLDHYHKRSYKLVFKDYNRDGKRDVSVIFNDITRIYLYFGMGDWKEL